MNQIWAGWTACVAVVATLAGCGGGGDSASTPTAGTQGGATSEVPAPAGGGQADSAGKLFFGVWKSQTGCSSNWDLVPAADSGKGSFRIDDVTFTETSMARQHSLFSDGNCTQHVGTVTYIYDLVWSASSITGWSDVARVDAKFNRYDVSNNSIVLDPAAKEAPGNLTKSILAIKDTGTEKSLYWGDSKSSKDAEGYPTAVRNYSTDVR